MTRRMDEEKSILGTELEEPNTLLWKKGRGGGEGEGVG